MATHRCAACGVRFSVESPDAAPHFPFCSRRCRMADLDRWFTEDYAIPGSPDGVGPGDAPEEGRE